MFKLFCPVNISLCPAQQCFPSKHLSELVWLCFIFLKQSVEEAHRIGVRHVFPNKNASPKLCCPNSHEVAQLSHKVSQLN